MSTYPNHWPKPNAHKPSSLQSRITETQKLDLYNRRITTRALAIALSVHEKYLSYVYSGKVPIHDKRPLIEVRKAYKLEVAKEILQGKYSIQQAANVAFVSYNTMQRFLQRAKLANPDLVKGYEGHLLAQKQHTLKKARHVRTNTPKTNTATSTSTQSGGSL